MIPGLPGLNTAAAFAQRFSGRHIDPLKAYAFYLEVEGILVGGFTSVEGIGSKVEVRAVRQGGANGTEYKLGGQVTHGDLILSSGLTFLDPMWFWYRSTLAGRAKRKNGSVFLLNDMGLPASWWNFYNAWPIAWEGPRFDSSQTLVASQRFTLAHEGIVKCEVSGAVGAAAGSAVGAAVAGGLGAAGGLLNGAAGAAGGILGGAAGWARGAATHALGAATGGWGAFP